MLPDVPSTRTRLPHLHCPLSTSQPGSASSCTPGREQLQSSQPMRGWQPKVWGSQTTHSGFRVWGGQMHCPVTSSQSRVPQSQAARGRKRLGLSQSQEPKASTGSGYRANTGEAEREGELTPAVGEAPVAGGTAGALAADDVGLAGTLSPEGLALAAPRPGLVAAAWLRPVVVEEGQRDGRVTAEPRGRAGAAGKGRRSQCCTSPKPPRHPKSSLSCSQG